jgi:AP2 domain/HNH endonuclease
MKQLFTTNRSDFAVVDDATYEWAKEYDWRKTKSGYFVRSIGLQTIYLHREIMDVWDKRTVDHINRFPHDNRIENLRVGTQSDNKQNAPYSKGSTRFKGVNCYIHTGKYQAKITKNYKAIHLGYFDEPEEAARAYDKAALELFGPNAMTNEKLGNYV